MKKIRLFCCVLFFIQISLFSQETPTQTENTTQAQTSSQTENTTQAEDATQTKNEKPVITNKLGYLFVTSGPLFQYNADGITSAPSPIYFNIGFGGRIPFAGYFSFAPHAQGYAGYYLWANETALPSSPENRTAYTPNLLIDLPILFELPVKESVFSVGIGIAILARYGFLTNGVSEDDYDDVPLINSWYWQNCRFLYPSAQLSWDFMLPNGTAIGLGVKGFLPLGNYFEDNPISYFQDGLLSFSARFFLKQWQSKKKPEDLQPTQVDSQTLTGIETQE